MQESLKAASPWIKGPVFDSLFFSFGWLFALVAFMILDQSRDFLIVAILMFSFLHRHLTYPLVYGDPQEFRRRKKAYLAFPILFLFLTLAGIFWVQPPMLETAELSKDFQMQAGVVQRVRVYHEGRGEDFMLRFSGREKTPQEVADTINRDSKGRLVAQVLGDKIQLKMSEAKADSRFWFLYNRTSEDLKAQLGLYDSFGRVFRASRPLLFALIVLSVVWNIYHTVMQKIGILRIYGRKAGYGKAWVDKALLFSWLIFLFIYLGSDQSVRQQAQAQNRTGKLLAWIFPYMESWLPFLLGASFVAALGISFLYLKEELRHLDRFHWPKNLFVGSILLLYASFAYDVLVGYAVFGFSHAIEYLAFVNVFARKKYLARPATSSFMARAVRHQGFAMLIYCTALITVFLLWHWDSVTTLSFYILGSSFLHFLYDGWIWKVRDPGVGRPLGIVYAREAVLQRA